MNGMTVSAWAKRMCAWSPLVPAAWHRKGVSLWHQRVLAGKRRVQVHTKDGFHVGHHVDEQRA